MTDGLTQQDMLSYAYTITEKLSFPAAVDDPAIGSGGAQQNQQFQYLNSREIAAGFQRIVFD